MNSNRCFASRGSRFTASLLLAAFACSIAVGASPQLHAKIHRDANKVEHTCAATLIASGSYHHAAPAPVIGGLTAPALICTIASLTPQWVESSFLSASVFEHAPPVCA